MNKGISLHAEPPTLIALLLFTAVSLGLGVVANLCIGGAAFSNATFWAAGRWERSPSP